MTSTRITCTLVGGALVLATAWHTAADSRRAGLFRELYDRSIRLTSKVEFLGLVSQQHRACAPACPQPAADAEVGRRNFGLTADGTDFDDSQALFAGASQMLGVGTIVSNGRTCATCHRPDQRNANGQVTDALFLGLPHTLPMTATVPLNDVLFTGREADDGNHPDAFDNLNQRALVAIKPGRFNPLLAWDDPFRQLLVWRKVPRFVNTGLTIGFLNDGRMREIQETARGAMFSHTQNFDERFDDLLRAPNPVFPAGPPDFEERPRNIATFIETTNVTPAALQAFLNPTDPALNPSCSDAPAAQCTPADCQRLLGTSSCDLHAVLVADPFFTVPITTAAAARGKEVFRAQCLSCHNTPNVFGNIEHVPGNPLSFPPRTGRAFDIGVAQRNRLDLDFRAFVCTAPPTSPPTPCPAQHLVEVVLPLVQMDGSVVPFPVTVDPGTAGATARYEDLFRFKVPQLRQISQLGPYFHDNSAATLEEVLDHLESRWYTQSADGKNYPIHLTPRQRQDLLAFLRSL